MKFKKGKDDASIPFQLGKGQVPDVSFWTVGWLTVRLRPLAPQLDYDGAAPCLS